MRAIAKRYPRWAVGIALALALLIGYVSHQSDSVSNQAALSSQLSALKSQAGGLSSTNAQLQAQIDDLQGQLREAKATQPLPTFKGALLDEVQAMATDVGWNLTVKEKESAKPVGTVLSQSPEAGTIMHYAAPFTVVVAKPLPPKAPNLFGKKQKDAQAIADKFGWKLVVKKEVSSEPAGTIISQTPGAGTFMRGAATLTVVIAKKAPAPPSGGSGGSEGGSSNCHPSYTGACLKPDASDYDCAGGSGNGPYYVEGPVYVVGPDVFGLDADGDGVGCE